MEAEQVQLKFLLRAGGGECEDGSCAGALVNHPEGGSGRGGDVTSLNLERDSAETELGLYAERVALLLSESSQVGSLSLSLPLCARTISSPCEVLRS